MASLFREGTQTSYAAQNLYWPIWIKHQSMASNSVIWTQWAQQNLTTATIYGQTAQSLYSGYDELVQQQQPVVRSAAEIAENEARIARQQEEVRAYNRRREEAEERAEVLLLSHLTPKQKEDYVKHKYICFKGRSGANYRIRAGSHVGNVDVMDKKGKEVMHHLCAHPTHVPMADTLLTQLFTLRHHEADFLRIANRH